METNKEILAREALAPHSGETKAAALKELDAAIAGGTLVIAACEDGEIELTVQPAGSIKQAAQFLMLALMDAATSIDVPWSSLPNLDEIQRGLATGQQYGVHIGTTITPTVITVKAKFLGGVL